MTENNKAREIIQEFRNLKTREDVAIFLSVNEYTLINIIGIKGVNHFYDSFTIMKKNGNSRLISAPKDDLKFIQKRLAKKLQILYLNRRRDSVHGFLPFKSIKTNAKEHLRKKFILNIDLKDFFESITYYRVKMMFIKGFGFEEKVANTLCSLVCLNKSLPQGAPTSPILTNLICSNLDKELINFARNHNSVYTRYADDITFSTNDYTSFKEYTTNDSISNKLVNIILKHGFEINGIKTRMRKYNSHKEVTGIVINSKLNLRRSYIKNVRALLHKLTLMKNEGQDISQYKRSTMGKISHIGFVRGKDDTIFGKYANIFDQLYNSNIFNFDSVKFFDDWIKKRVFLVMPESRDGKYDGDSGSGFYLKKNSKIYFVTCFHVIEKAYSECRNVRFGISPTSYNQYKAFNFTTYKEYDLAFLEITNEVPEFYLEVEVNYSNFLRLNTDILIAGYPEYNFSKGRDGLQCATMKISTSLPVFHNEVEIYTVSNTIRHGFSGGPVLNQSNKVIGYIQGGATFEDEENDYRPASGFVSIDFLFNL